MLMETKTFKIAFALEALTINLKYKVACDKHCASGTKEVSKRARDIKAIVLWVRRATVDIGWFHRAISTTSFAVTVPLRSQTTRRLWCCLYSRDHISQTRAWVDSLIWLESGLPVNRKSQMGPKMLFLCPTQKADSLFCWTGLLGFFVLFLTESLRVPWAAMQTTKCSQQRETQQRAGSCCHHLKFSSIWNEAELDCSVTWTI